ncbi:hypothetical protein [Pseudomonas juntendi]|uniref:hypothetical protein n=1 Tax=Pseudomonas juntendi TaxID=2666183 RepID=UPI002949E35C|nr:hypothetical protein [Pseudomonas juntendi]MDV5387586.1 hypothetical protein [Pseudomonas juntendi]
MLKKSFLYDQDIMIIPGEPYRCERMDGTTSGLLQKFTAVRTINSEVIAGMTSSAWNVSRSGVKEFFDSWFNLKIRFENWDISSPEYGATWQLSHQELFFGPGNGIINYTPPPKDTVRPEPPKFNLKAMMGDC